MRLFIELFRYFRVGRENLFSVFFAADAKFFRYRFVTRREYLSGKQSGVGTSVYRDARNRNPRWHHYGRQQSVNAVHYVRFAGYSDYRQYRISRKRARKVSRHSGKTDQNGKTVFFGVPREIRSLVRTAVRGIYVNLVPDTEFVQNGNGLFDDRKIARAAHDKSDFFHFSSLLSIKKGANLRSA